MNKVKKLFLIALMVLSSQSYADLSFAFRERFDFTKTTVTREDLDKGNFERTGPTSSWNSDKEFLTYVIAGRAIYQNPCKFFALVDGEYGWVIGGRNIEYPRRWHVKGHTEGFKVEAGYTMDLCQCFDFIPYVGFRYNIFHTKLHHEHFTHRNPDAYVSRNGNKTNKTLYFPYIGIELAFTSALCNCYDVQFSTSYEFGYGAGHGRTKVPRFILTDDPNTSNYGQHVKYRNMISHDFTLAAACSLTEKWQVGLELEYYTIYNTHNLPVKLQKNKRIVESGQFTPSQFHVLSEDASQTFSIIFSIVYNFCGTGGGTFN